jgi:AAA+ ATPase superfamily predicted ATPase
MMERGVLSRGAPLYGRRTMQLRVERFHWRDLHGFFPDHGAEQVIEVFSVLDGIPLYLEQFSGDRTIAKNLMDSYLRKDAFLYEEAEFLLLEEFREPRRYFSILRTIASGKRTFGEIADGTSLDKTTLSKYLSILQDLRLVVDDLPFGGESSRLRRYRLSDNYLRFWFRYVYPNKQLVEVGRSKEILGIIRETFPEHVSVTFEEVVRDELIMRGPWTSVRPWWDRKGENEVDAVAVDERGRRVMFVEAKWTRRPVGWRTVHGLMEKSSLVPVDRRWDPSYLVVSRSGFTRSCLERMDIEGVEHWGLEDLDQGP